MAEQRVALKAARISFSVLILCAAGLLPFAALVFLASGNSGDVWRHVAVNVLPQSIVTTVLLIVGVGLLASTIGVTAAWLVSRFDFLGRSFLQWALVLPLAVPTYLSAYCFVELLDFSGPVQQTIRRIGGYESVGDYWFPDIRSLPGAVVVMAIVLYPYIYLTSRILFAIQAAPILDTSRILGAGPWRGFFSIGLPLARPAIVAGATLAMLEALNDIGAVEILGVRTLTFAIFDTWLNRSSLTGAAQISLMTLVIVALLVFVERRSRGGRRYAATGAIATTQSLVAVNTLSSVLMAFTCLFPVIIGFVVPVLVLGGFAVRRVEQIWDPQLAEAARNSVAVSAFTAVAAVLAATVLIVMVRRSSSRLTAILARMAMLGYVVPGSVLAIGTLYAFSTIDNGIDAFWRAQFGTSTGLIVSGSAAIVIYGCTIRFLAIANGAVETGYAGISLHLSMAARTLGRSANETLLAVEVPLLRRAFAVAGLLVFVDTMKELSATILLRPFGFSTLATFVYERASRAVFEDAAIAALIIVAIGIVPILLLDRIYGIRRAQVHR